MLASRIGMFKVEAWIKTILAELAHRVVDGIRVRKGAGGSVLQLFGLIYAAFSVIPKIRVGDRAGKAVPVARAPVEPGTGLNPVPVKIRIAVLLKDVGCFGRCVGGRPPEAGRGRGGETAVTVKKCIKAQLTFPGVD